MSTTTLNNANSNNEDRSNDNRDIAGICSHIAKFIRPVARDEIPEFGDKELKKLVDSGDICSTTISNDTLTVYWVPVCEKKEKKIERLNQEISSLQEKLATLNKQLDSYSNVVSELSSMKPEINSLHDYNDMKDTAQMLLGKLAEIEGVRTATLYPKFGLSLDD